MGGGVRVKFENLRRCPLRSCHGEWFLAQGGDNEILMGSLGNGLVILKTMNLSRSFCMSRASIISKYQVMLTVCFFCGKPRTSRARHNSPAQHYTALPSLDMFPSKRVWWGYSGATSIIMIGQGSHKSSRPNANSRHSALVWLLYHSFRRILLSHS